MQNAEVARVFEELADLLEIQGANAFRVRAYRNAARTIGDLPETLSTLVAEGTSELTELPGIGKDLAEKIVTIVETGELPQLAKLRKEVPPGVVDMLRIEGLGPKKVGKLFHDLGLESLEQLREAAERGEIAKVKGFGKKTAENILEGLERIEQVGQRTFLSEAKAAADRDCRGPPRTR